MKRRSFFKRSLPLAAGSMFVNGLPIRTMGRSLMMQSFDCEQVNDRVLVLIQLHGGNDGLNTVIPLDQYDLYKNYRPVIGILNSGPRKYLDLDTTLDVKDQVGLHPDMIGIKDLYDQGKVNIVQNVSYTNNNGSHFRGKDIWLSGVDGTDRSVSPDSGWFGRYLDHKYPNYPTDYPNDIMPDPPGLEFGSHIVSLGFHRVAGIPMGLTLSNNPTNFLQEIQGVTGLLPENVPDSDYGRELKYVLEQISSTNVYAEVLAQRYEAGTNATGVVYPESYHTTAGSNYNNRLAPQLRTIARLISGGCKTRVYLARMGGFDTHANQAIAGKPSFGGHGALLYHLSEGIRAFHEDLKAQGLEDRVLTVTFSEFGRQVKENGDWGTDHGSSAPMLVVGKGINPGVTGTNPDIANLKNNRVQGFEHDYRQVFATIIQDWFGANDGTMQNVEFLDFTSRKLDLINSNYIDDQGNAINFVADPACDDTPPPITTSIDTEVENQLGLNVYPNPASTQFEVTVQSDRLAAAEAVLIDMSGRQVKKVNINLYKGENKTTIQTEDLNDGVYILQIVPKVRTDAESIYATHKVMVQHN